MSDLIAYCGLDCGDCKAYKATKAGDRISKEHLIENWADRRVENAPEDIECEGCKSSKISGYCQKLCLVRPCAMKRRVSTCAECEDYPCGKLKQYLSTDPVAAKNIDEIRKSLIILKK
ncbi:MAG: hypothetical protein A4E32_00902 [Methanomassiliicoccales archaeon PtaU1.Bin124]|nr:MAG: hypothetical protein A4E32_00902 [Methanomassiliicoccales archaeon PtaU1.Bin124]